MTEDEIHLIRHALGLTYTSIPYRNFFAADPISEDYRTCLDLEDQGLMRQGKQQQNGLVFFHVTEEGKRRVAELSTTRKERQ